MSLNFSNSISSGAIQNSSVYCQYRRTIYQNLKPNAKITLRFVFTAVGIIGVLINALVVVVIHRTKQLNVQSIILFRNFSILDIFTSLTNFVHLKAILDEQHHKTKCEVYYVLTFILHWAIYSSSFMVFITGLDRYIHIKYLTDYDIIFTRNRFKVVGLVYLTSVLYQATATTVALMSKGPKTAGEYTVILNVLVFLGIIFFYSRSIFMLKKHMKATRRISSMKRNITKIAALYFYFYIINIGILIMFQVVGNWTKVLDGVDASSNSVIGIIYFILPGFTAIVNAFGFLRINRKAKRWMKSFLPTNRRIQNIDNVSMGDIMEFKNRNVNQGQV